MAGAPPHNVPFRFPALLASVVLSAVLLAALGLGVLRPGPAHSQSSEGDVAPEAIQAIRLLLSGDAKDQARGEAMLRRMGPSAAPHVREWMRRVRLDLDRISPVLSALEGDEPSSPSTDRLSASEFLSRKTGQCRDLMARSEYRRAEELAEAILVLDPKGSFAWELRRIVKRAKAHLMTREVLEPVLDVGRLVYEAGQKPEFCFRVANRDTKVARIRIAGGMLGEMDVVVTRHFIDGNMKREERKLRIRVAPDVDQIIIGPGQEWEHPLDLEIDDKPSPVPSVARVQVAGRFRPTRWTVDREGENISLPMNTAECWIVPVGEGVQCERPIEKLTTALFFKKVEPLFVGGQIAVWVGEDDPYVNEDVVSVLVESLEDLDEARMRIATRLLAQATGQAFGEDPKKWKAWWAETMARRGSEPAAR